MSERASRSATCTAPRREGASTRRPSLPSRWTASLTSSEASSAGPRRTTAGIPLGQGVGDEGHRSAPGRGRDAAPGRGRDAAPGTRRAHRPRGRGRAPAGPDHPGRRRRAQQGRQWTGPAPGGPFGQGHHGRRGAVAARAGQRLDRHTGRSRHTVLHHPAADPAPVEVDAHPAAHPDLGVERGRHRVVEPPMDGRHVGHHPDDARPAGPSGSDPRSPAWSAQRPRACFRSSARVVSSQVNSFSERPK